MTTLEKIRAEIENTIDKEKLAFDGQFDKGLNMALKIIDKYAEQEEDILDALHIAQAHEKRLAKQGDKMLQKLKELECIDAVSREAVLDLCDSKDTDYKVIHFKEDVECLPSVRPQEPKQKTGHWVEKKGHRGTYIECSECGGLAPSTEFADGVWFKKSNFCHECGARMESEGEE